MSDKVIAIGASAGGLSALRDLLAELPEDFAAPIVVAVHGNEESRLAEVLERTRSIALPARRLEDGDTLEKGVVHVVPGATHAFFADGHMRISDATRTSGYRPSIDALFITMAAEYGENAVGVVLSGMLNDGMRGAQVIFDTGGVTVVQDPADAEYAAMPQSVINQDHPRTVLPADELGRWLRDLVASDAR